MSSYISLLLIAIITIAAAQCNCGTGLQCCNNQCYDPTQYSCPTDSVTGQQKLCSTGSQSCNGACYSPSQYHCANGGLVYGPAATSSSTSAAIPTSAAASTSSTVAPPSTTRASTVVPSTTRASTTSSTATPTTAARTTSSTVAPPSTTRSTTSTAAPTTSSPAPSTTTVDCQTMYAQLTCTVNSTASSSSVSGARTWLCQNYPQYCTQVNSGGQYASCTANQQMSYAMSQYYNAYVSQGASACSFGGIGVVMPSASSTSSTTSSRPLTTSSTASPTTSSTYAIPAPTTSSTYAAPAPTTSSATPSTTAASLTTCQAMFANLTCRSTSEDPSQITGGNLSGARNWLCQNYPNYCTQINSGGQWSSCNLAEQFSYAANLYYLAFQSQGSSACNFGGVAALVSNPATTTASTTAAPVVTPVPAPVNNFPTQTADLRIINNCGSALWFEARYGGAGAALPGQTATATQALPGGYVDYVIPDTGLSGTRFWAKYGCDSQGKNCLIGDQMQYWPNPPGGCPPGGCTPPIDSLFEATWGCKPNASCNANNPTTWFDTSQVDGWTIPYTLTTVGSTSGCDCTASGCGFPGVDASKLDVTKCPSTEDLSDGGQYPTADVNGNTVSLSSVDLRIINNGSILGCMSPCKRLNWGTPYGLQQSESSGSTLWMCCPTPTPNNCTVANGCVTSAQCQAGPVVKTQYVHDVHTMAPGVYSYAYDDGVGLHACPAGVTLYTMTFCPAGSAAYPGVA